MIILCRNGEKVDTARLSPEERHVIQKLLAWQSLAESLDFFKEKTSKALADGWNGSGPLSRTRALDLVIASLETDLIKKLAKKA